MSDWPPTSEGRRLAAIEAWARETYPNGEVPEVLANALWHHVPPRQEPDCDWWPECSLDRDRCAAIAVMGRGNCPNQQVPQGQHRGTTSWYCQE